MNIDEDIKKLREQVKQAEVEGSELFKRYKSHAELMDSGLPRFPLGLPVKDRDGRTGVVVGYLAGKVLVQETGVPSTETPPPVALAPEHIAPVHPRPSRYELLAAVEARLLRFAQSPIAVDDQDLISRSILVLAQARALL